MPTSYTSLLGLALPVTGELSGTWGDTVNNYITQYLDSSVAGTQIISGSQTAVTLSPTNGSSLAQVGSGLTGSSQYGIIRCSGNPASTLTVTVSYSSLTNAQFSQQYAVINATSTSQSVVVRATTSSGTSSGVTLASGERAIIAWNGSDFVKVASTVALPAGSTTQVQYNNAGALAGSSNLTFDGTTLTANDFVDSSLTASKPVFTNASKNLVSTGTVPVDQGGTGLTSGTSGGVLAFTASGTIASSNALAANAIVIGGGAGAAPATTTTGTGVVTAIGNAVNTSGGLVTQSGTLAASSLLLGGGASTAISSTTTGTGVVTALGTAVGSAGAFVVNGGALGTPSSGTVTNLTGTASININGTVGATTPNTGAFTSVTSTSASGILTRAAATQDGVEMIGRAGGTLSYKVSITPTTLTGSRTVTLPDANIDFTTGLAVANGGTGSTTASGARTNLGATTVGGNFFTLTNPSAITFPRINADNTVSALDAATFRSAIGAGTGSGTVTSVSWTGGIVSVGTATTTPAFTIAGTSGGIPYFSSASTWATSAALAANSLVIGGGAGVAPSTTTTGTGVLTALGTNVGSAGAFVVNGGALGTPSSGTVTNLTGTASININGTVGATTPSTGAFTTLTTSSNGTINGNLFVGTTGQINSARLSVADSALKTSSSNTMAFGTATGGATDFQLIFARSAAGSGAYYSIQSVEQSTAYRDIVLQQNGGNVGIGTTSATSKLTVSGGNVAVNVGIYTATNGGNAVQFGAAGQLNFGAGGSDLILATNGANVRFGNWNTNTEQMRLTSVSNLSLGGTADRGTTVGTNAIQIFNGTAPAGTLTNGVSLYSSSGDLNFMNSAGNGFKVGYRNLPPVGTQTGSYTLAAGDVGKYVQVSTGGSITIPTSVFAEGDAISIYNNTTGNITITCSAPTAYIAGTNTVKTSMTLATRGVATVLFYSATACVVSGNVT